MMMGSIFFIKQNKKKSKKNFKKEKKCKGIINEEIIKKLYNY